MPLKIAETPTFTRAVTARVPQGEGHEDHSFHVTFRLLGASELTDHIFATPEGMTHFLQTIVTHIDGVVDEAGKAMAYSETVRDAVIEFVPARNAIFDTYTKTVGDARLGN